MVSDRKSKDERNGRYAYEGLDRIMHEKARLGILTSLMAKPKGLLFSELKQLCLLTDGNLSRHLQALQEAGLVEIWKGFHKKRPQTLCRMTDDGRQRFLEYLAELEKVVKDAALARKASSKEVRKSGDRAPEGWLPA